jgi:hypothetical protein
MRRRTAAEILSTIDEVAFWRKLLTDKDKRIRLEAARFLTMMRDGRPYQQSDPNRPLPSGDNPKLAAVIENLLSPGGSITLTEKKMQISGPAAKEDRSVPQLESATIEAQRETVVGGGPGAPQSPLTIDASASSQLDPSGHKAGGGQNGAEVHPKNFQDSGARNVPKNGAGVP